MVVTSTSTQLCGSLRKGEDFLPNAARSMALRVLPVASRCAIATLGSVRERTTLVMMNRLTRWSCAGRRSSAVGSIARTATSATPAARGCSSFKSSRGGQHDRSKRHAAASAQTCSRPSDRYTRALLCFRHEHLACDLDVPPMPGKKVSPARDSAPEYRSLRGQPRPVRRAPKWRQAWGARSAGGHLH